MPLAAAGIGAAGSIIGGIMQGNAQSDAINAQRQAAAQQIAEYRREFDIKQQDLQPWLTTGGSALDQLAKIYGLDTYQGGKTVPGTGTTDFSSFWKSPDYNIALKQGIAGVDAGAAAGGSLDSGATRKAEMRFASGLGTSQFNSYANRLAGIAGVGQTSAESVGNSAITTGGLIGGAYQNLGNNLSGYALAQGNMYGNMIGGAAGIGSGLIQNNPQWFGGYNPQQVNVTPNVYGGW